jgi:hypothetical protein
MSRGGHRRAVRGWALTCCLLGLGAWLLARLTGWQGWAVVSYGALVLAAGWLRVYVLTWRAA